MWACPLQRMRPAKSNLGPRGGARLGPLMDSEGATQAHVVWFEDFEHIYRRICTRGYLICIRVPLICTVFEEV